MPGVDPRHDRGVERLLASYAAIPAGQRVRLAKRTSNLFRPREAVTTGLDTGGLTEVIRLDPQARTADVQGMCTYERLVAATLPHGLMPLVVPQLRTITLGGAVSGLGIEATSFRNGLPHESVLEMDILTGDGDLVTAGPSGEHADLYVAFPNSYGSLGYATRLRIELQPIGSRVLTRNVSFTDLDELCAAIGQVMQARTWDGSRVDAMDAVVFGLGEAYLVLARFLTPAEQDEAGVRLRHVADYGHHDIYYRSLQNRFTDMLSDDGFLWRWDTDWFWCSEAFGAQNPRLRRWWPRRYLRSDVYHRLVGLDNRYHLSTRLDRARGLPERERVIQDVEIPLEATADYLRWFLREVSLTPVWLCPLALREPDGPGSARAWPLYPLAPGRRYVNIGFWGTVPIEPGRRDGDVNRAVEDRVDQAGGHKSLYSDVYYDRATFDRLYGGSAYRAVKDRYDPAHRLPELYDKATGR